MGFITKKSEAMTNNIKQLSRLMRISWDIQKRNNKTRSKALQAAWAIMNNENVTVHYLVSKLNHHRPVQEKHVNHYALFPSHA